MLGRQLAALFLVILWAATTQASTSYSYKYVFYVDPWNAAIQSTRSSHTAFSTWSTAVAVNSVTPAADSQVAVTAAKAALHLFYQDNYFNIFVQPSPAGTTWNPGSIIVANTTALHGTALAATTLPGTNEIHLWFQDSSYYIRHIYNIGSGWVLDTSFTTNYPAEAYTPITVTSWNPHTYRVFYIGTNGHLYQLTYTASGGWSSSFLTSTSAYRAIAADYKFAASVQYQVYFLDTTNEYLNVLPYSAGWGTSSVTYSTYVPGGISALWDNSTYNYVYLQDTSFNVRELYVTSSTGSASLGTQLNQAVTNATYITSAAY